MLLVIGSGAQADDICRAASEDDHIDIFPLTSAIADVVTVRDRLIERGRKIAAVHFEAAAQDIVFEAGQFSIVGTDRGIGIEKADQERVFERFFRVDKARSRATGGTGLGLAIVKHVAANHNGSIRLWSQPGTGSTFTLSIPAYPDEGEDLQDQ